MDEIVQHGLEFEQMVRAFAGHGATSAYLKRLAPNDNSKNQVYLGPGFAALNVIPAGSITAETSSHGSTFKAAVGLSWLQDDGTLVAAPSAQMILYPQYPEVRMSGFLKGSAGAPGDVMASRDAGRVLLLGVRPDGEVIGYAAGPDSPLARHFSAHCYRQLGVFEEVPLFKDSRTRLLAELRRIHAAGWLDSVKLGPDGPEPYLARNGGGYTLEAHLGILPNGRGEPDFDGWEVKQHSGSSSAITLMTPEPTRGVYVEDGVCSFLRKYGYPDKSGVVGRTNFGGVHKVGVTHAGTGLQLTFDGYDPSTGIVSDTHGSLDLVARDGTVAAGWSFDHLLALWTRKHAQAVYVPSEQRTQPQVQYRYCSPVKLGIGTDFLHLLSAMAVGEVYYDPGIKMVESGSSCEVKKRSQWRVRPANLPSLYEHMELVDL